MSAIDTAFLKGSFTPIVTPFRKGAVDYDLYASLVEHQVREGSDGVLVNGTTAEPSLLTVEERNRLVDIAVQVTAGRIPVVAATGSQSHAETVTLTEHATRAGVDALLIVTPYYVRPSQRGLIAYYNDLGTRTDKPILMYHIPGRTAVSATVDTLVAIAEATPHFVGMKHAVNDLEFVTSALVRLGRDFRVFVGLESLSFPMMMIGATGVMNAVGNIAPAKVAALCAACRNDDVARARKLHFELFDLNEAVFFDTNPGPVKYMMKRLGLLPDNEHRLPMMPVTAEVAARLDKLLLETGLVT